MYHTDENEHISSIVSIDEANDFLACQQREKVGTELEKQENQQATSSKNQNLVYFPDSEIGTRLRKPTEKGNHTAYFETRTGLGLGLGLGLGPEENPDSAKSRTRARTRV